LGFFGLGLFYVAFLVELLPDIRKVGLVLAVVEGLQELAQIGKLVVGLLDLVGQGGVGAFLLVVSFEVQLGVFRRGQGGVEGDFELEKNGLCRIAYLSKETMPEVGDKIYSSGNGNIYPEDLYIGEVIEVAADPLSHTMTGYIKPAVNFDEIKNIMVILEFKRSFY
jgi:cell shape-determining protein MreC